MADKDWIVSTKVISLLYGKRRNIDFYSKKFVFLCRKEYNKPDFKIAYRRKD